MSEKAVRTLWSFLGVYLATFSLAAGLLTTGSESFDALIPVSKYSPYSVPLVGVPVISLLFCLLVWLALRYPIRGPRPSWSERLPVFYFDPQDMPPASKDGRRYQLVFLLAFYIFPIAVLLRLLAKFFEATATDRDGTAFAQGIRHLWPASDINWEGWLEGDYRLDGFTYYPVLQPWANLALSIGAVCALLRLGQYLFLRRFDG